MCNPFLISYLYTFTFPCIIIYSLEGQWRLKITNCWSVSRQTCLLSQRNLRTVTPTSETNMSLLSCRVIFLEKFNHLLSNQEFINQLLTSESL
ncbi:hypothetical protein XENTR_v10021652 [Xenopus tropicalis]|nr:hypothetical protein XENTR_v10021652 [Xenopus tropicalis]KAE8586385.1 hypothetical protein XENTR_v10021652 [Xenopus tropicalis]KAE8586386.1 hypothetical protein XENTR_v10021652 [Xenopus tropicalis]KAE8586387.1 hypothetical protein XENTR_v10021652 [Xenopus tropicalis]